MNEFINNDIKVILANSYFVYNVSPNKKFFEKYFKSIYNKKLSDYVDYSKNESNRVLFNFFSTDRELFLSEDYFKKFYDDFNNTFIKDLEVLASNNLKPRFFHYKFHDHITSLFVNYSANFIVFYNSNKTVYDEVILKDIVVYLNLVKHKLKGKNDFKVYIVNTGKQTNDAFCYIYTHIFLIQLLKCTQKELNNPQHIIKLTKTINKEDTCEFLYNIYNMYYSKLNSQYLKIKDFKNITDIKIKDINSNFYELVKTRSDFKLLGDVSCKVITKNKNEGIYSVNTYKVDVNEDLRVISVCGNINKKLYYMNGFDIDFVREIGKCRK